MINNVKNLSMGSPIPAGAWHSGRIFLFLLHTDWGKNIQPYKCSGPQALYDIASIVSYYIEKNAKKTADCPHLR